MKKHQSSTKKCAKQHTRNERKHHTMFDLVLNNNTCDQMLLASDLLTKRLNNIHNIHTKYQLSQALFSK